MSRENEPQPEDTLRTGVLPESLLDHMRDCDERFCSYFRAYITWSANRDWERRVTGQ